MAPPVTEITPPIVAATATPVATPAVEPKTRLIPPKPKPSHGSNNSFWRQVHDLNTNALALVISAFVLIIVASIIAVQIYLNQEKAPVTNQISAPESLLLNTNLNLIVNSTNDRASLLADLNNLKPTGQEIVQVAFMEATPANNQVSPVSVLNLLGLDIEKI